MSKQAFANAIISKLKDSISTDGSSYNGNTAQSAMTAIAQAITEYIVANTTVTISYTGIISSTPPSPDPIVTDTFRVVGNCAPLSPSDSFDSWLMELQQKIIAGFQLAPSGSVGIVFAMTPFLSTGIAINQQTLKSAHDIGDESPQQKIWEIICDGIMQWINNTALNQTPGPATRPSAASAGQAIITKITLV